MVQQFDGFAAIHPAADGIQGLIVCDSNRILAHRKPLVFDFNLHVPRTLVSGVTDVALQTTCGRRKTV